MRHKHSETAQKQRIALNKSGQYEEEEGGRGVFVADVRVTKLRVGGWGSVWKAGEWEVGGGVEGSEVHYAKCVRVCRCNKNHSGSSA